MLKTLIVEDNANFRQSLKEILHTQFPLMVIEEAMDGNEALQKVRAIRPDLVFMDIRLPGETGLVITKKIRAHNPRIIIIILTSYDLPEYRQAASEYGANYFLSKHTSTGSEVLELVESILSDQGEAKMTERLQVYKCEVCGNIVEVLHEGKGELVCCKQPMKLLVENTVDAAKEKHVPMVEKTAEGIKVKVGSTAHPMEEKHYIEWIEIIADGKAYRQFLKPGDAPEATFNVDAELVTAREYCNLHGLWKA
jgi:superoxide reductase